MRLEYVAALLLFWLGISNAVPAAAQQEPGNAPTSATAKPRPIVVIKGHAPTIEKDCPALPNAQLQDLSCSDATKLIEKLKEVQTKLKAGEPLYFELFSGGPASSAMTNLSPRKSFTEVQFEKAFILQRVRTDNHLWRPYKFAYKPAGAGENIWDIEVVLGFTDEQLMRVQMRYGPPPPF